MERPSAINTAFVCVLVAFATACVALGVVYRSTVIALLPVAFVVMLIAAGAVMAAVWLAVGGVVAGFAMLARYVKRRSNRQGMSG